ncbi:MAG: tRNA (cytidine(34)-2'-O)-methyltransferase [Spartobacteria bacterium]
MDKTGFNVVLVEPEIPPNTGNVARLCLATQSTLHLVKPFGFTLEDRQLKRAGLDYWQDVDLRTWESLEEWRGAQSPDARCFFLTTKMGRAYDEMKFQPGDFLVFGRETKGLPKALLDANADCCLTIPMHGTRSLNLATAVAIVLFEAMRQQRFAANRVE